MGNRLNKVNSLTIKRFRGRKYFVGKRTVRYHNAKRFGLRGSDENRNIT